MKFSLLIVSLFLLAQSPNHRVDSIQQLNGVYYFMPPFLTKTITSNNEERVGGFLADLMQKIAWKAAINFKMARLDDGDFKLALKQVYKNQTDFAIGDIDDRLRHKEDFDLTEPIMVDNFFGALVPADTPDGICTLIDAVKQQKLFPHFSYVGDLGDYFHRNDHSLRANGIMHLVWNDDEYNLKSDMLEAIEEVVNKTAGGWALLGDSTVLQHIANNDCRLRFLPDTDRLFPRNIVIALRKGSPHLAKFNFAIRILKQLGIIKQLWNVNMVDRCKQVRPALPICERALLMSGSNWKTIV